jgi:hypothetical protein
MSKDILPGQLFLFTSPPRPADEPHSRFSLKYVGALGLALMKTSEAEALSEAIKKSKEFPVYKNGPFKDMLLDVEAIHAEKMLAPGKIIVKASFSEVFGRERLYLVADIIKNNIADNRLPPLLYRIVQELNKPPK